MFKGSPSIRLACRIGGPDENICHECVVGNCYDITKEKVSRSGVVLDIGANIGAFSCYAASLDPKKVKAYAFEPEADNYALLCRNIDKNLGPSNIVANKLAVFSSEGMQVIAPAQGGSRLVTTGAQAHLDSMPKVATVTLMQALDLHNLTQVDFLKMDCEWSEYEIIAQASEETLRKFWWVAIEFHPTDEVTFGKLIAKLSRTHKMNVVGSHQFPGKIFAERM
jgi:FkbM family methyltransferase